MIERLKTGLLIVIVAYGFICTLLYFLQESLLFYPSKLASDYQFEFTGSFKEVNLETSDGSVLNGVLFSSSKKKGVVLFLHGNGGAIHRWGQGASIYTENGYDVFYIDYRGYGKSEGKITSEKQLINDGQVAYNYLKQHYPEAQIIVSGTSIGTGIATQVAAQNNPMKLILNAPYYSLLSLVKEKVRLIPSFIVKYKLSTVNYVKEVKCPIVIFHGVEDAIIPHQHTLQLKSSHPSIKVELIKHYGHNDLFQSVEYIRKMSAVLKNEINEF